MKYVHAVMDCMAWLDKADVNVDAVKAELTQHRTSYGGEEHTVELFDERDEVIGVPRRWALLKYERPAIKSRLVIKDKTQFHTFPAGDEWPHFQGTYWDGQEDAVNDIHKFFQKDKVYGGLLKADPGAGKTVMGLSVAALMNTPTLIVVPKTDLAAQWKRTALGDEHYDPMFPGIRFGHVQGRKKDWEDCHAVTATVQTLYSQREKLPIEFWKYFGMVIFDEGHRFPARTFEKVLRLPHARYRFGVSATWRRRDDMECAWFWHVGKIQHEAKIKRLGGTFTQIEWDGSPHLKDGKFMRNGEWPPSRNQWITAIAKDAGYNEWLCKRLQEAHEKGRQTLVVSDRIDQLEDLQRRLELSPATVSLYIGRMNKTELAAAKECDIILATYAMMAEGTDIPTLDTLIFGTPRGDVEQTVGRIRRPADKKPLLVVDPFFKSEWNKQSAKSRRNMLKEIGFVEHDKSHFATL